MNYELDEQVKAFKQLEKANFTSEQIEAIVQYIDNRLDIYNETLNIRLSDIEIEIRSDIKYHEHLNGKVYLPFEVKRG